MDYSADTITDESGNIITRDIEESFWYWQKEIVKHWFNFELPNET